MHLTLIVFILALGLTARFTRLVVADSITAPVRNKIGTYANTGIGWDFETQRSTGLTVPKRIARFVHELLSCEWCFSVWAGAGALWTADRWSDTYIWQFVAYTGLLSFLTGVATTLVYRWSD